VTPPLEFLILGIVLVGVSLYQRFALAIAAAGLAALVLFKLAAGGQGLAGNAGLVTAHLTGEWVSLANLFLLLLGFAVLSNQFERSRLPEAMPRWLPKGWTSGLMLLVFVFVLSVFLDNIAAALIGGVVARHVFRNRVSVGFQAAIVAASNGGGAGSVIGDTTTTMMWISGIHPLELAPAFVGSIAALAFFAPLAAVQQRNFSPALDEDANDVRIDWMRVGIVAFILAVLVATNVAASALFPALDRLVPLLGLGLWLAVLVTAVVRRPDWSIVPSAVKDALFLIVLVAAALLLPVDRLPSPSLGSVFGLGLLSSVFNNIPLTALALNQGGYDWALLAYAVGFGGSMVWFGSSAGVALTALYPEGRSIAKWLRYGWYVPASYFIGFAAMLVYRTLMG
jgi:Na+/H+ antiporter NhaD/arsenite permease-like protein